MKALLKNLNIKAPSYLYAKHRGYGDVFSGIKHSWLFYALSLQCSLRQMLLITHLLPCLTCFSVVLQLPLSLLKTAQNHPMVRLTWTVYTILYNRLQNNNSHEERK